MTIRFDGVNDYLSSTGYGGSLFSIGSNFTISTWISPTALTAGIQYICSRGQATNFFNYEIYFQGSNISMAFDNGPINLGTGIVKNNEWQNCVMTCAGSPGSTIFYYNGSLITNQSSKLLVTATSKPLLIGAQQNSVAIGSFFNGQINDFRFYNTVKSAQYIKDYYNHTKRFY